MGEPVKKYEHDIITHRNQSDLPSTSESKSSAMLHSRLYTTKVYSMKHIDIGAVLSLSSICFGWLLGV